MTANLLLIYRYRNALKLLLKRHIAMRHKGTVLGVFWLVLEPLLMVVLYTLVFSVILKVRLGDVGDSPYQFALYLISALMPFYAFQEGVIMSSSALLDNADLIKKSTIPAVIFPLVVVLGSIITEWIALVIVVFAAWLLTGQFSMYLLLLPLLMAVRFTMTLAVGWLVSFMTVFIRDLSKTLGLLLTIMLFLTPVFYPEKMIPAQLKTFNHYNPFYYLLEAYRSIIIKGSLPDPGIYTVGLVSVLCVFISLFLFGKAINRARDFL